jgi:hypothetical protein
LSSTGLVDTTQHLDSSPVQNDSMSAPVFMNGPRSAQLVMGNRELLACLPEVRALRRRLGQEDDLTTDPEYFIAANTLAHRRCAAVLIRRDSELEACVLFYEHTRMGFGLGLFRGGDYIGESLVAGSDALRVHYVHLATQELLKRFRIHGVSLTIKASAEACAEVMGAPNRYRRFRGDTVQHKLPLESTYEGMLASMGPRTRRSLAGKRQQLEKSTGVKFLPVLEPDQALEVMLGLEEKAMPQRISEFFHARHRLLRANREFFSMGLRLPDGPWLSLLSGWRFHQVTYVDLQMNDMTYKKESISAVMRAFMLEHEIGRGQKSINFVAGSSVLLRRYCEPIEPSTDVFIAKPGMLTSFFEMAAKHARAGSVYERVKGETNPSAAQPSIEPES